MSEENNNIIDPKEQTQQNTLPAEETQETVEQINWRNVREERKEQRRQKEESDKKAQEALAQAEAMKAALDAVLNKPSANQYHNYQQPYQEEETEDERIQKKVDAALKLREAALDEQRRQREHQEYPQRLASTFTDFNQVCSADNLDYLEYHYPEVAAAFKHVPDGYDKWSSVYKAVKRFVPNTDSKKDQNKAEKNFNKPQSIAVPGVTQSGDTAFKMNLDEDRKKANYARMQKIIKGQ